MGIKALARIYFLISLILLLYGISYAPIVAADALSLEATMISLDHQYFPFIYLNVAVDRYGKGISTLTKSNFQVTENGFSQTGTAYFNVIPPESGDTNQRPVDIIFLMDNSGSMSGEQNAVRQNVEAFVDELRNRGVDCQLGLCRFGASQNSGNPIIEDNGSLTSDVDYFKDNVWNRNVTSGGFEPGWDALYAAVTDFAFRKEGPQKVFILITDETPTDNGNVGTHTKQEAIDILKSHYVTTFALIELSDAHAISDYGEIAEQTNGAYYNILDPFDGILNYISNLIPNNYRISYKSSNPVFDDTERHVEVTVTYQGDQATCDGKYTPGSAPIIRRTQDTLDLHKQSWAAGTDFTIRAEITDAVEPYAESATLYYRNAGDSDFTPASMTHSSDIWVGSIPGSAVETPWVGYYILATDGENTVTDPSVDPMVHPYILAILPNEAPQIIHTAPADVPDDTPITITAQIVDTTNALASTMLYYRKVGAPLYYDNGDEMNNTGGDTYQDIIPREFVTPAGVEYYILAVDDLGTESSFGTRDDPQQVWISTNHPPEIENLELFILGNTATFDWKGTDDNTPVDQLEYSCRLIAPGPGGTPDYTKYDWTEWSSAKTQTYEDLLSGDYTFQVHARDSEGAINGRPKAKEFTIGGPTGRIPVIIIPGIMGSELWKVEDEDEKERIWPDITGVSLQDADDLALTASGGDKAGVSIQEGDILRSRIPNVLWLGGDIYGKLIKHLTDAGYKENKDLFIFPYDWRKDLSTISVKLAKAINKILADSGAEKVDIVAHSMGGLVARYYINKSSTATPSVFYQSATNVRKLILLATPSYGSPDAFKALHPELGRGMVRLSDEKAQDLSANWPAVYQLLPTTSFFELYDHIFEDFYYDGSGFFSPFFPEETPGALVASSPAETWKLTFVGNGDSNLARVNEYLLEEASFSAWRFHEELGATLNFTGPTYIVAGSGKPTELVFVKKETISSSAVSTPATQDDYTWTARPTNGDGTVPLLSVTRLNTAGPLYIYHTSAKHADIPNDKGVKDLVLSILQNSEKAVPDITKEKSLTDGSREDEASKLSDTSIVVIKSPVELHIYTSQGDHIGPNESGFIETTSSTNYFALGKNTVAFLPMGNTYTMEFRGIGTGHFGLEILELEGQNITRMFSYEDIEVTSSSQAILQYDPSSSEYPALNIDTDGNGSIDVAVSAQPVNTLLDSNVKLSFDHGRIAVVFNQVTSAGQTACLRVDTLPDLDPSFKPVSSFYSLCTFAEFTGLISITIQYDEANVPAGRESDLRLYRIRGEDAIEDITQKLDEAANVITGQTDGFSYFVVGYMSASPETSILSPTTGDTVTGQSCRIHWQATDPDTPATSLSIDLFYSTNGGSTWTSISSNEANDGVYDWDISALQGGEYWLKVVAKDPEGGTSEATVDPFTISVFEGNIIVAPNPVTSAGTAFFYSLPEGTSTAKLMILNVTGRLVFENPLDADSTRFPSAGTWHPVDQDAIPLANGPYVYVLIADGKTIGQGKMVIQQ